MTTIEIWAFIWQAFFIAALAVFAVMSVAVSIGGWFDVRRMLERLAADEKSGSNKN